MSTNPPTPSRGIFTVAVVKEFTTLAAIGATVALAWHGVINGEAATGIIGAVIGWKAGVQIPATP